MYDSQVNKIYEAHKRKLKKFTRHRFLSRVIKEITEGEESELPASLAGYSRKAALLSSRGAGFAVMPLP